MKLCMLFFLKSFCWVEEGSVRRQSVSSTVELFQHSAVQSKSNNPDNDEVAVQECLFSTNVCADSDPDVVRCQIVL